MVKPGYRSKKKLFKPIEISLYQDLLDMAGSELKVLPKLPLWDLLEPDVNQWERSSGWDHLCNQIIDKQISFVILDTDWSVVCLVNLIDGETGEQIDPITSEAVHTAKLPLVNIFSYEKFTIEELAQKIAIEVQKVQAN